MKEKLILFLAIVCGILAMVFNKLYLDGKLRDLNRRFEMEWVVAASKDLASGTVLTEDMVAKTLIPRRATSGCVKPAQLNAVLGQKLRASVPFNTPLMWSCLADRDQRGGGLANMVREGDRAVSIPVDVTSSVTGLVEPNDHVDILGTFTFPSTKGDSQLDTVTLTILQNVTVLATGKQTSASSSAAMMSGQQRGGAYSTVTLLVTPKEAEMLVFAMQKGRLTLTLRSPSDVSSARDLTNINFNYLERKVGEFNENRQERLRGANR
ncbi:MAG: Flp pilus assembly protein CpaB [Verrucomicrobiae bacterium]|nr:Flp pilus assembly protein CpaB [Verrucomicrobiae bacterium]